MLDADKLNILKYNTNILVINPHFLTNFNVMLVNKYFHDNYLTNWELTF